MGHRRRKPPAAFFLFSQLSQKPCLSPNVNTMGGRRTGVLAIGSSEGIALGNGGPLRSRALAENKFVGTATTLACLVIANPSATLSQMSFDTRVMATLLWLFHVI
jgi:hypothetical protein